MNDPVEFMRELHKITGPKGYLIITTPNADFVRPSSLKNTMTAMLAPSQHIFLLSKNSLTSIAKNAGFEFVKAWTAQERLFLLAGSKPVELKNVFPRTQYVDWLSAKLQHSRIGILTRYRAFGYRLFMEYVNLGDYEKAAL